MRPPHIVILGLGGVGGYFGGLWTRYAMEHPDQLCVSYLMRPGTHYDRVRREGLRISSPRLAETVVRHLRSARAGPDRLSSCRDQEL